MSTGDPVGFWMKQYEAGGNDLSRWADKALGLVTSADVLKAYEGPIHKELMQGTGERVLTEVEYKRTSVGGPALMLLAMATECYLKALWLKQGNDLVKNGAYVSVLRGNEHRLDVLAAEVAKAGTISEPATFVLMKTGVTSVSVPEGAPVFEAENQP